MVMQTFITDGDYHKSHRNLDPSRLGNQIYREALTLARRGWPHHSASIMWRGHIYELCEYAIAGLDVLHERGHYYPHHYDNFRSIQKEHKDIGRPWWMLDGGYFYKFIRSHKSNLIRKLPDYYSQLWPDIPNNLEYLWPDMPIGE